MKRLIAGLLLFLSTFAHAEFEGDRAKRISAFKVDILKHETAELKTSTWVVTDTGQDMNLGEGDGPVVVVKIPGRHQCLLALHPTEEKSGLLACEPLPEGERTTEL